MRTVGVLRKDHAVLPILNQANSLFYTRPPYPGEVSPENNDSLVAFGGGVKHLRWSCVRGEVLKASAKWRSLPVGHAAIRQAVTSSLFMRAFPLSF